MGGRLAIALEIPKARLLKAGRQRWPSLRGDDEREAVYNKNSANVQLT